MKLSSIVLAVATMFIVPLSVVAQSPKGHEGGTEMSEASKCPVTGRSSKPTASSTTSNWPWPSRPMSLPGGSWLTKLPRSVSSLRRERAVGPAGRTKACPQIFLRMSFSIWTWSS